MAYYWQDFETSHIREPLDWRKRKAGAAMMMHGLLAGLVDPSREASHVGKLGAHIGLMMS